MTQPASASTQPSLDDIAHAELAAVTGAKCGFCCVHLASVFKPCQRAVGHAGATVYLGDGTSTFHLALDANGKLMVASDVCEHPDPNAPPYP